jgi:hypothetical protein
MMDETDTTNMIIRLSALLLIGLIIISGVVSMALARGTDYKFSIKMYQNPSDGDTITLAGTIYEFDSGDGVAIGHIPITIGATLADTISNIDTAINSHSEWVVT